MQKIEKSVKTTDRPRVLVIDDDPGVRDSIRLILERDYEIIEAESVAQSMIAFDQQEPDLITLDVYMPEVDGMAGLDMFRKRSNKIPIILISGHHTFELARQALRLGANDYLTKPFTEEELRQPIQAALAKARYDENSELISIGSDADFTMRLPRQNVRENKENNFLSEQHRSYFLTFAQKVFSKKKPVYEEMYIRELVKTVDLQVEALQLTQNVVCEIANSNPSLRIKCDMYLLGGALANLAFTCMMETESDNSPLKLIFAHSGMEFRVLYKKSSQQLPEDMCARFENWHNHPSTSLDADTAMLAVAEKVVQLHQGQFNVNMLSGSLLNISLPVNPAPAPVMG
jgi:DNA-binding response OmpR family regulator